MFLILFLIGCGPKCLQSHTEPVFVPAHTWTQMMPIYSGRTVTYMPILHYEPDHYEDRTFCDKYAEK